MESLLLLSPYETGTTRLFQALPLVEVHSQERKRYRYLTTESERLRRLLVKR